MTSVTAAPLIALLQAAPEATGGASWTFRNWLGLGCQVVVFVLLVAFIFWLADLKNAGPESDDQDAGTGTDAGTDLGTDTSPVPDPQDVGTDTSPVPNPPAESTAQTAAETPETADAPAEPSAEPSESAPEGFAEPPAAPERPAES